MKAEIDRLNISDETKILLSDKEGHLCFYDDIVEIVEPLEKEIEKLQREIKKRDQNETQGIYGSGL